VHPWHFVAEGHSEEHDKCMQHFAGQVFKTRYNMPPAYVQWQTYKGYKEGELTAENYTKLLEDMPLSRMTVREFLHSPYNLVNLPYTPRQSVMMNYEVRSQVCTRCVRPFYEPEFNYSLWGNMVVTPDKVKITQDKQSLAKNDAERIRLSHKLVQCKLPFDVYMSEQDAEEKLNDVISRLGFSEEQVELHLVRSKNEQLEQNLVINKEQVVVQQHKSPEKF
jgi:hypothetical protein